ncbi:hypothetical protein BKP37_08425 [Anaerobacillus alkalilacustris]|uniref:QacE family quaternary ammonium compound efflux SMR transporter n=1 Tax=Anaerobacillus alkalilacustris TaxID=393763 RepID=A0A1S2LQF7_9BACI|nr:SMR family transporter [Anaerobacillus alkalilacustris]OIJ14363.1 hypothetical protein BKP37_08425 [Anaerobacillus alkalilacustris]
MIYLLLFTAIIISSFGDIALKKSKSFRRKGIAIVGVLFYLFTFYLLSNIVQEISVGVTYATWSGLGVVLTSLAGEFLFREKLNLKAVTSMFVNIIGVVLLNI